MSDSTVVKPLFSDATYSRLKAIIILGFPATSTLFAAIAALIDFDPNTTAIVLGILAAVATFLGVILTIAQGRYDISDAKFDGEVAVTGTDPVTGNPNLQLTVTTDPNDLVNKDVVKLKSTDLR